MLFIISPCTRHPIKAKKYPAPNVSSAKLQKLFIMALANIHCESIRGRNKNCIVYRCECIFRKTKINFKQKKRQFKIF